MFFRFLSESEAHFTNVIKIKESFFILKILKITDKSEKRIYFIIV